MFKHFLLPVLIVLGGVALAAQLLSTGPTLQPQAPPSAVPLVRTWRASPQTVQLKSVTHGTVAPRTQSELIPEVAGRVIAMSASLVVGGFFRKGDLLISIDPLDYEVALEQARAALVSAESNLATARRAHQRQLDLAGRQLASEAQTDDAANRLLVAEAKLREAKARLARAERDLQRTQVRAPYDGRVRSEKLDIGQFIDRGKSIASIYATDYAEVRLPVPDDELAFLQLPLGRAGGTGSKVLLRAEFAGKRHLWQGRIVRTEGEIDPQTRMINLVAEVAAPYAQRDGRPPLAVGLFVEAEILGREVPDVYSVPRSALQADGKVYVVDGNDQLVFREVDILRIVGEQVYIQGGFRAGETVCLSTLNNAVQGMQVRPVEPAGGASS